MNLRRNIFAPSAIALEREKGILVLPGYVVPYSVEPPMVRPCSWLRGWCFLPLLLGNLKGSSSSYLEKHIDFGFIMPDDKLWSLRGNLGLLILIICLWKKKENTFLHPTPRPGCTLAGLSYHKILFCNLKTPADWQLEMHGNMSCQDRRGGFSFLTKMLQDFVMWKNQSTFPSKILYLSSKCHFFPP